MNISIVKRVLGIAVIGTLAASTPGCTDGEVAAGLGAIAIGAGAVAIGVGLSKDRHDDRHDHDRCVEREECRDSRDWYGNLHRECRRVVDGDCHRRYGLEQTSPLGIQLAGLEQDTVSTTTAQVAENLNISFSAAQTLQNAIDRAAGGDLTAIYSLGLTKADYVALSQGQLPADQSIDALAKNLNLAKADTLSLVIKMRDGLRDQMRDSASAYWQTCLAQKAWRTDKNSYCEKTFWEGCSVETGANFCLSL